MTKENNKENQNKDKQVDIKIVGQIDLPTIDLTEYVGKKVKIEKIETYYNEQFGSYYLKCVTEKLGEYTNKDNEIKEITANRIFGLQTDENGQIGWGEKTNLGLFMTKYKLNAIDDLKGLQVITQTITRQKGEFLTFN